MAGTTLPRNDLLVRSAALAAAILLHLPLFLVGLSRERPVERSTSMILVDLDSRSPTERPLQEIPPVPPSSRSEPATAPAPAEPPAEASEFERESAVPNVDWRLSGAISAQAAVDALIREESYRPLGKRKAPQFVEPEAPSIFEKPKHRYGDITEGDAPGKARVWHNENCYTELDKPVSARPTDATIGNVNIPKCVGAIGRKEPRGDLFEHLKRKREE